MSAKTAQGRENPPRHLTEYRTLWDHGPRAATRATSKMAIGKWKMDNGQKERGKWQREMGKWQRQVASKRQMASGMI